MRRLREESGFTLMELVSVMVVIGVLTAIAVTAYAGFTGPAQTAGAKSDIRSAIPAAEQFSNVNAGYAGISGATLRSSSPGVGSAVEAVAVHSSLGYCLQDTENGGSTYYNYVGGTPGSALQSGYSQATIQLGTCLQAVGVAAS